MKVIRCLAPVPPNCPPRVSIRIAFGLFLFLLLSLRTSQAALDRPFTLINQEPHRLEKEREAIIAGADLTFVSPTSDPPASPLRPPHLFWKAIDESESIAAVPIVGGELRTAEGERTSATEAGALFYGRKSFASFHLDARMFFEQGDAQLSSFDREDRDKQNETTTGTIAYTSYARYRGDFTLDTRLGRLIAARDAAHWGPALFSNLTFQQNAVPFDQIVYQADLGPLRVTSLYGDLIVGPSAAFSEANLKGKSLYAHRYELKLGHDWLVGLSEQLFLYGQNRPFLFIPIYPLFIAKGFMYEEANNGNLAMDISYRIRQYAHIYGEFLLDDLESPSSLLFKQYSQNKWGLLVGAHTVFNTQAGTTGAIAEYSRLEPWVYTHFTPYSAQAANLGYSLGNPYGPNSEAFHLKFYFRSVRGIYIGALQTLTWKGSDAGSSIDDPAPREATTPKSFLAGSLSPDYLIQPELTWNWNGFAASCVGTLGTKLSLRLGLRYFL
jgi:hypothetical protein